MADAGAPALILDDDVLSRAVYWCVAVPAGDALAV